MDALHEFDVIRPKTVAEILERVGYEVTTATSGKTGLMTLDAQSFGQADVGEADVARMSALVDELLGAEAA